MKHNRALIAGMLAFSVSLLTVGAQNQTSSPPDSQKTSPPTDAPAAPVIAPEAPDAPPPAPVPTVELSPAAAQAALKGDWQEVLKLTEIADLATASSTFRIVRGHACLALNKNNEATLLFFGTRDPKELESYHAWAQGNLSKSPDDAYAKFYAGDAFARLGKWDDALGEFDALIAKKSDHALAYNARGVVHAFRKETGKAGDDFLKAQALNTSLADARCNYGYLCSPFAGSARKQAVGSFTAALGASPGFGLALYGRSSLNLANKDAEASLRDLAEARSACPPLSQFFEHADIRSAFIGQGTDPNLLIAFLADPGSSFRTRVDPSESSSEAKDIADAVTQAREKGQGIGPGNWTAIKALDYLRKGGSLELNDSRDRDWLRERVDTIERWNAPGGGARAVGDLGFQGEQAAKVFAFNPATRIQATAAGIALAVGNREMGKHTESNYRAANNMTDLPRTTIKPTSNEHPVAREPYVPPLRPSIDPVQGGARADMAVIDGKWPFAAIYGLGYGIVE